MKYKPLIIPALILTLPCIVTAQAAENWICKIVPGNTPEHTIPTRVDIQGEKLLLYNNDLTGKPNAYKIIEDTDHGVIAIRHEPNSLTYVMIDRQQRRFTMHLASISSTYEEKYSGVCSKP